MSNTLTPLLQRWHELEPTALTPVMGATASWEFNLSRPVAVSSHEAHFEAVVQAAVQKAIAEKSWAYNVDFSVPTGNSAVVFAWEPSECASQNSMAEALLTAYLELTESASKEES